MGPPGAAPLRLLPLLLALLDPGSTEDVKVVNALVGGTIDLPLYYPGKATGYTWTKENNRVTEWDEGLSVTYYDTLRGRCELDTSTGVLTIRDLKEEDSARYKGEALVNNIYFLSNFHLQVFPSLNNPTVTCNNTGGIYTILCDHRPEPKTYTWRSKAGLVEGTDYLLTNFNKTLTLTNAKVPFQSLECVVQNPVSQNNASLPKDCFITEGEDTRGRYGLIPACILFGIAVAFLVYLILIWLVVYLILRRFVERLKAPVGFCIELRLEYTGKASGYRWRKGNEKIAEWLSPGEVSYGDAWKDRCQLDKPTGTLTITDKMNHRNCLTVPPRRRRAKILANKKTTHLHLHVWFRMSRPHLPP